MKQKPLFYLKITFLCWLLLVLSPGLPALTAGITGTAADKDETAAGPAMIEKTVKDLMEKGNIPGLGLVIVNGDNPVVVKGFGYADLEKRAAVTPGTLFELASCSKAFTALAALQLESKGLIHLDDPVSGYLPWFYARYKGKKVVPTLRQVLHQTSGIPFKSISVIPQANDAGALERSIRNLVGIELSNLPGTQFEYATINYDIIGLIIQQKAGTTYEDYIKQAILTPLGMKNTLVGYDKENPPVELASEYKISFFSARKYESPSFRGNNPAGYIMSSPEDMAMWLKLQLGLLESDLAPLAMKTHQGDMTVPVNRTDLSVYGMGWFAYVNGSDFLDHPGNNPGFSAHISLNPREKLGVAVLANVNTPYTRFIAYNVMSLLRGKGLLEDNVKGDQVDKSSTILSLILILFLLGALIFFITIVIEAIKGHRRFEAPSPAKIGRYLLILLMFLPFAVGVYFIPYSVANVSMKTALVFSPGSFQAAIVLLWLSLALGYCGVIFSNLLPHQNKYRRSTPLIVMLSVLSGGANAVVIFLVTNAIFSKVDLFFQLYNFALAFFIYIFGRKILQTKLIKMTFDIVYDMRMKLIEKIFYTSYQRFEKIDRGRVFATLNDDTGQIGNSANIFVNLITSIITAIGAFIYLATIAFWATALTLLVVAIIATLYAVVSRKARAHFEAARDTRDVYMQLLNGLIDGFKELSLQYNKKTEYRDEVAASSDQFRQKISFALIKFLNAFLIGESLLIVVLGIVGFGITRFFPDITTPTLMSFIMVLLYLIGPINAILNAIPAIVQLKVAWNRVKKFLKEIPANVDPRSIDALDHSKPGPIESIQAKSLFYEYEAAGDEAGFTVGPLDFEAHKGEIVFIIGGNGSGKTTLAKLLTGLYLPNSGKVMIDGKEVSTYQLGEYFSVVFGNYHLFQKMYNVDLSGREKEVLTHLNVLKLDTKVMLEGNTFSTIDLSGGQRKRLALLQCYLEDRPIYLFDEIAADQDPEFRKFFYRDLLPRMKEKGKVIIAITHDDHYFDVADKIVRMDMGKIDILEEDDKKIKVTR